MANDRTNTTHPVLTTTFTPAPECTELTISTCYGTNRCFAVALTNNHCSKPVHACFPQSSIFEATDYTYATPYVTYSPANFCPEGWSTAATALAPDGVWCCPNGFGFNRDIQYCEGTFTEGTAVSVAANCEILSTIPFGPDQTNLMTVALLGGGGSNTVPASQLTITATAQGIFLQGQTLESGPSQSSPTSTTSIVTPSVLIPPPPPGTYSSISTKAAVGASIGGTIAIVLLLSLGFFLIRRHRKRRRISEQDELKEVDDQDPPVPGEGDNVDGTRKPELEGSNANPALFRKNELDANATRSELLGDTDASRELDGNATRSELQCPTSSELELQGEEVPQELETPVRYELQG
ncbi:hypothetical protein F4805DRAFT_473047 [Annulohypoxylon moriforme]|nr:hypothetical protein F4805DRAFT_473047 [Annulohypoxylon moriforme]